MDTPALRGNVSAAMPSLQMTGRVYGSRVQEVLKPC